MIVWLEAGKRVAYPGGVQFLDIMAFAGSLEGGKYVIAAWRVVRARGREGEGDVEGGMRDSV